MSEGDTMRCTCSEDYSCELCFLEMELAEAEASGDTKLAASIRRQLEPATSTDVFMGGRDITSLAESGRTRW